MSSQRSHPGSSGGQVVAWAAAMMRSVAASGCVVGSDGGELAPLVGRGEGTLSAFLQCCQQQLTSSLASVRETLSNPVSTLHYGA
jgi:hypothetical protein